jgi:hypothetical protein
MKRTQHPPGRPTPAPLRNYPDCPECPGVLSPGHVCQPRYTR